MDIYNCAKAYFLDFIDDFIAAGFRWPFAISKGAFISIKHIICYTHSIYTFMFSDMNILA